MNGVEVDIAAIHGAEFRRCLLELDIPGMMRIWRHVAPHLPQPKDEAEALHTMHLARVASNAIPLNLRTYSREWLAERERAKVTAAVGISVNAPPHRHALAEDLRGAMTDAVLDAVKAGVLLDEEAAEVKLRMNRAREKIYYRFARKWH